MEIKYLKVYRYVVTESHNQAMEKLEKFHSIIITGSPGVGKTSLADQLCQYYAANEFEFCYIENSLNEAEENYDIQRKQVFYFDDFLGRNFLLALGSHQDSQVINFIKRVQKDATKRFILTSRSNVLNKGKHLSDLFEIKKIERNEYELSIEALTDFDKAKILYNHIWFSQLNEDYISELYKEQRYLKIVKHQNFNPRLISFITDIDRLDSISPGDYWSYIELTLSNPQNIWQNVFDVQIDEICRHITIGVSFHGKSISEEKIKKFSQRLMLNRLGLENSKTFDTVIKLLTGALLNRNVIGSREISYDLFNPSIADYVIATYLDDLDYVNKILNCLQTTQSIDNLYSLYKSGVISKEFYSGLICNQLTHLSKSQYSNVIDNYKLKVLYSASKVIKPNKIHLEYITALALNGLEHGGEGFGSDYYDFIIWVLELNVILNSNLSLLVLMEDWVKDKDMDYDEYLSLSKLVKRIEPVPAQLTVEFKKSLIDYLSEDITRDAIENGVLGSIYDVELYDESEIHDFVSNTLSEFAVEFFAEEVVTISECCDIDDVIQSNINAYENEAYAEHQYDMHKDYGYRPESTTGAIIDLFDRG